MSIPPRHDLTTSQGKAKSDHYIKHLIKKEKHYYGTEALVIAHPLQETFLAARRFFLEFVGSPHYLNGTTIYAAQFMFEKFYAGYVAPPSEGEIEISKKCCLAVMVKLMESRHDRVREHPYEVLYSNDSIHKEVSRINDMEMQLMARMGYEANPPTPFDYLPRLVVEYFPDASEYEMKYTEVVSLLLKQMAREDFDAPIATSKPSALALVATSMIASYPDPPVFSTDNVLNVNEVDFQRYVGMMQGN